MKQAKGALQLLVLHLVSMGTDQAYVKEKLLFVIILTNAVFAFVFCFFTLVFLLTGAVRKFGRNQVIVPQVRVARTISVKDVIAVLEREPQMSKSTLIYQLYERTRSDTATE